jgi:hypothetical protein
MSQSLDTLNKNVAKAPLYPRNVILTLEKGHPMGLLQKVINGQ